MQHSENPPSFSFWKYVAYDSECLKILMQFTGLKDKNGKKIWEGDILDIESEICVVKYNAPSFAAYNSQKHEWNIQYAGVEIIGNIYENPELLVAHP